MTEISGNSDCNSPVKTADAPSAFGGSTWHLAIIAILGLAIHAFSLFVPFHGEDQRLFLDTPALQSPLTALQALGQMPYAPLTLFGYALNACANPGDPLPLHAVNIMLHVINALLIYALLVQLLGSTRSKWALGAALIFLIMTPGLYSAYYLAARPGMQATCFALFALIAFAGASEGETLDYRRLIYAAIAYALAVGSHAVALGLPLAMLALDASRGGWARVLQHRNLHAAFIGLMLLLERIWTAALGTSVSGSGIFTYAWSTVAWNSMIAPVHNSGLIACAQPNFAPIAGGLVLVIALLCLALSCWKRSGSALGWALLLVAWLAPATGLLPSGELSTAQQAYFPTVGFVLGLAIGCAPFRRSALVGLVCLIFFSGISGFIVRLGEPWGDPVALWNKAAGHSPEVARECLQNAARYALEYGRRAEDPAERGALLAQAEIAWKAVIDRNPKGREVDAVTATGLGETFQALGRGDEALQAFQQALAADPFHAEASLNAGLLEFARMQAGEGEAAAQRALEHFRRLEKLGPLPSEAWGPYALVLTQAGDFAEALEKARSMPAGVPPLPESTLKEIEKAAAQVVALQKQEDQYLKTPDQWKEAALVRAQRLIIQGRLLNASYLLEQVLSKGPNPNADALLARIKEQMARRSAPAVS